jgi:hypothetical protein
MSDEKMLHLKTAETEFRERQTHARKRLNLPSILSLQLRNRKGQFAITAS